MTITELLNTLGFKGKTATHVIPWNSLKSDATHYNPNVAYSYDNIATISTCLDILDANGVSVLLFTYQGPFITPQHSVVMNFVKQIVDRGMMFALVMDQWAAGGPNITSAAATAALAKCFANADVRALLASPAYIPEKAVLDFGTGADYTKVGLSNPIWFRHREYSWVEVIRPAPPALPIDPVVTLAGNNKSPTMKIPGLSLRFFDGGMPSTLQDAPIGSDGVQLDFNQSNWQAPNKPQLDGKGNKIATARYVPERAGNYFFDQLAVTPMTTPYIALVTLDDYHEGTQWLTHLSVCAGKRIS